jgi:Ca2+-binding EF-hand superfamily protein
MIRSSNTPEDEKKLDGIEELIRDKMVERTHGTETEAHALERIFRFFDTDATGSLTLDEFGRALLQIGIPIERRWVSGKKDHSSVFHFFLLVLICSATFCVRE